MPVTTLDSVKPIVYIPPRYSAVYKLEVTLSDDTTDDVTTLLVSLTIEDGATESIGSFEFEIWDPQGDYKSLWTGNEIVKYYSDYASSATTLRFRGRIEKVSYQENKLKVSGRSESLRLMEITVTKTYEDTECSEILTDLIETYGQESPAFGTSGIEQSSVNLTVTWVQKPFWECVQELCNAAGFDVYVDSSLDVQFFEKGSRDNVNEGIVHTYNLVEVNDFAEDLGQMKNRVVVYGAKQQDIQLIYTAEDSDSIAEYDVREEIIEDDNITDYASAKELGDYKLAQLKDPPVIGNVKGLLLASVQPGDRIKISSPENNISPGGYNIISYKHEIGDRGLFTTVYLNKEPRKISHVVKRQIERQYSSEQKSINPFEMRYSYNFMFSTSKGTHNGTATAGGVLKLVSGSSGTWESPTRNLDSDITEAYLVANGSKITGASFEVSGDGGAGYEQISNRSRIVLSSTKGKQLRIKVTISDTNTEIDSLSIQYKTE